MNVWEQFFFAQIPDQVGNDTSLSEKTILPFCHSCAFLSFPQKRESVFYNQVVALPQYDVLYVEQGSGTGAWELEKNFTT